MILWSVKDQTVPHGPQVHSHHKGKKIIKHPPPEIARSVTTLQEYYFDVKYRAGKHHVAQDQVSVTTSTTILNTALNLAQAQLNIILTYDSSSK